MAVSRTCDYHHHWQDVTVGSALGMAVTFLVYRFYYPSLASPLCAVPMDAARRAQERRMRRSGGRGGGGGERVSKLAEGEDEEGVPESVTVLPSPPTPTPTATATAAVAATATPKKHRIFEY